MTHRIALAVGWTSVACALILVSAAGPTVTAGGSCWNEASSAASTVSEAVERSRERCARGAPGIWDGVPFHMARNAMVLATCVRAARYAGVQPADRLEYEIANCMVELTGHAAPR